MSARPILAGFYPDPSICRVGTDYYLATSTFEYLPGVPVFHSVDLIHWTQIGNALSRPDQLTLSGGLAGASRGIFAPTLRHHAEKYWMITTNVGNKEAGHLIVHANHPTGPWSPPVYTDGALGIDPDLTWDGPDCYLTWKSERSGESGIWQALVDPLSGRLLSDPGHLWSGTGLAHTEGPHLFKRGNWWYLLVAEGGTGRGHVVSVARSASPTGPFEAYEGNPIFSHRSTDDSKQSTGHADMVECPDGRWAMVYLAVHVRGAFPRFHVNGRETYLAGVDWLDEWPVIVHERFDVPAFDHSFHDDFRSDELDPRWIAPGRHPTMFARNHVQGLCLDAGRNPASAAAENMLAVRARDASWTASAQVASGDVALQVRIDDEHWFAVELVRGTAQARAVIGTTDHIYGSYDVGTNAVVLELRCNPMQGPPHREGPDQLEAGLIVDGAFVRLGATDGRYISSEVAGGFTGRVVGIEALGGPSIVGSFDYRTTSCAGNPAKNTI